MAFSPAGRGRRTAGPERGSGAGKSADQPGVETPRQAGVVVEVEGPRHGAGDTPLSASGQAWVLRV